MTFFECMQMVLHLEIWRKIQFKEEPRNVRLSLVADGVNPYAKKRSIYLVWPIFVINNNISRWLSIKREHVMLAIIIPGMCLQQIFLI